MSVRPVTPAGSWLHRGRVPLCLVQPAPLDLRALLDNKPRDVQRRLARALLAGGEDGSPWLNELLPASQPAVVCFPELCFIPDDWDEVDALVRGYPGPLLLAAGFGFATGTQLSDWANGRGDTCRQPVWDTPLIAATARYNGAWIWVHTADSTTCHAVLKNRAEPSHEFSYVENWRGGEEILALQTPDLTIYPLICFDLLDNTQGAPLERVLAHIQNTRPERALILGMLLQGAPFHEAWGRRLEAVAQRLGEQKVAIVLCHYAYDEPHPQETTDRWRSLAGLYRACHVLRYWNGSAHVVLKNSLPSARLFHADHVAGMVIRHTEPSVVAGHVPFDFDQVGDRYSWATHAAKPIEPNGSISGSRVLAEPVAYEVARMLRRHGQVDGYRLGPLARQAVAALQQKLGDGVHGSKLAKRLCSGIVIGTDINQPYSVDHDALATIEHDWVPNVLVLAVLLHHARLDFSENEACYDLVANGQRQVYRVWQAKELTRSQIHEHLRVVAETVCADPRPLVVIVRGSGSHQPSERLFELGRQRRVDRPSYDGTSRRTDQRHPGRTVRCLPWSDFSEVLVEGDAAYLHQRLTELLSSVATLEAA